MQYWEIDLRSMNVFLDADEWLTKLPRIL